MTYHIVFKENNFDKTSKGEDFNGLSPIFALKQFSEKYPTAVFMAMYSSGALEEVPLDKVGTIQQLVDKEDVEADAKRLLKEEKEKEVHI